MRSMKLREDRHINGELVDNVTLLPFADVRAKRQLAGRVVIRKGVVVVVVTFTQCDGSDPSIVRGWNGRIIWLMTPEMGCRIDEPRAVQDIPVTEDVRDEEGGKKLFLPVEDRDSNRQKEGKDKVNGVVEDSLPVNDRIRHQVVCV